MSVGVCVCDRLLSLPFPFCFSHSSLSSLLPLLPSLPSFLSFPPFLPSSPPSLSSLPLLSSFSLGYVFENLPGGWFNDTVRLLLSLELTLTFPIVFKPASEVAEEILHNFLTVQ